MAKQKKKQEHHDEIGEVSVDADMPEVQSMEEPKTESDIQSHDKFSKFKYQKKGIE